MIKVMFVYSDLNSQVYKRQYIYLMCFIEVDK